MDWVDPTTRELPDVVRKASLIRVALGVAAAKWDIVEVPEPLAFRLAPHVVIVLLAARIAGLFRRQRPLVVTYAIENLAANEILERKLGIPPICSRRIARIYLNLCLRMLDRVAFGTTGARENYTTVSTIDLPTNRLFEALPMPDPEVDRSQERPGVIVFLGSFEERKGFDLVLGSWPLVRDSLPSVTLSVLGYGELEALASDLADRDARVSLILKPKRSEIFEELRRSSVLVLPSRRSPGWREQVGLPIVEGLAAGLEVVTTDETGIASWLRDHGHHVVADATNSTLADAIIDAVTSRRAVDELLSFLPPVDQRVAADYWLMSEAYVRSRL